MGGEWEERGWSTVAGGVARRTLPGVGVTVGAVAGAAGLLVVDTGGSLEQGAELAGSLPGPVSHVVVTHGHWDHCFGTPPLLGPATEVLGHRGLPGVLDRAWLAADAERYGVDPGQARRAAERLVAPGRLVDDAVELDLGGCPVRVLHPGPGHTGHDLAVVVRAEPAVVFCGDLVEESGPPQAGPDAVVRGWPAALDRLLAEGGPEALYVPGHGSVVDARFVQGQRDALAARFGVS